MEKSAARSGMSQENVRKAFDAVFDTIMETVIAGEQVKIMNFGTFKPVLRKEKKGRNPRTMVEYIVPSQTIVKFIPCGIFEKGVKNPAYRGEGL